MAKQINTKVGRCGTCGVPVFPDKKGRARKYCSCKCAPQRQRGFPKQRRMPASDKNCKTCGRAFVDCTSLGTARVYCSKKCKTKYQNDLRRKRHPERLKEWWKKNPDYGSRRAVEAKRAICERYGGTTCTCCGESEIAFLTIDHVGGGGGKHRRELGSKNFYKWLAQAGYPKGFRVLCMNCNWATRYNKPCPHEKTRNNA